jgi:hypothetical protein
MTDQNNPIIAYPRLIAHVIYNSNQKHVSTQQIIELARKAVFIDKSIVFQLKTGAIVDENYYRSLDNFDNLIKADLHIFKKCNDKDYLAENKNDKKKIDQAIRFQNEYAINGNNIYYEKSLDEFVLKDQKSAK